MDIFLVISLIIIFLILVGILFLSFLGTVLNLVFFFLLYKKNEASIVNVLNHQDPYDKDLDDFEDEDSEEEDDDKDFWEK